jgi:hypothetical protein
MSVHQYHLFSTKWWNGEKIAKTKTVPLGTDNPGNIVNFVVCGFKSLSLSLLLPKDKRWDPAQHGHTTFMYFIVTKAMKVFTLDDSMRHYLRNIIQFYEGEIPKTGFSFTGEQFSLNGFPHRNCPLKVTKMT